MEAVQQNTSLEVQMSHSSGPRIQEALIYNIQYFIVRDDQMILSRPLFLLFYDVRRRAWGAFPLSKIVFKSTRCAF